MKELITMVTAVLCVMTNSQVQEYFTWERFYRHVPIR